MHKVKCYYCGETFDIDKEEYIKPNARRYAHKVCPSKEGQEQRLEQMKIDTFYRYIQSKIGKDKFNFVLTKKIIDSYIKDYKYTYEDMYWAMKWWFEVNKQSALEDDDRGVGIIPYIMTQAKSYYNKVKEANSYNKQQNVQEIINKSSTVNIPIPERKGISFKEFKF